MPDAAAHLAARSRSRAGCDAHPPTDCPAREMADARYAGHRDPPDRAGARPESVPGNHLPQALRCARSSPGCGSRALRKQYGPGRTRRPGPRQPDSPSLPDAVHEYRHRFPEGIFQTSCDDAALHGGRIGDREVIGLITVKHASGKEERDGRPPWGPSFRSPPLRCRPAGSGFRRPGLSDRQSAHRIHCVPIYGLCTKGFVEEYPIFRQRSDRLNRWQCRTESLPRDILHEPYLQNGSYSFIIGSNDTDRVGVVGREHNG